MSAQTPRDVGTTTDETGTSDDASLDPGSIEQLPTEQGTSEQGALEQAPSEPVNVTGEHDLANTKLSRALHHAADSARHAGRTLAERRAEVSAERRLRSTDPWGVPPIPAAAAPSEPSESAPTDQLDGPRAERRAGEAHRSAADAPPVAAPRVASSQEPPTATPVEVVASQNGGAESVTHELRVRTEPSSGTSVVSRFGVPGAPINRAHPFVVGFQWAVGALLAYGFMVSLGRLSSLWILLITALFLALALDPVVRWLEQHGVRRSAAVATVFVAAAAAITAFFVALVPSLIREVTALTVALPDWLEAQQNTPLFQRLDRQFGLGTSISEQLSTRLANPDAVIQIFGGVLGAGQAVVSGAFSVFTVLVLTLYLLASLPSLQVAIYQLAPRSRRERAQLLGDEIIRRIGGYTAGQVAIASLNASLSYVLMVALGLPFPLLIAVLVGLLGLIPMIGATLGAGIVVLVALFQSWQLALIAAIYYIVYQQIENYLIAPRVMSRTVQMPGFLAVFAALAGAVLMGVFGALIAIPVAAAILLLIQEVILPRQDQA